LEDKVGGTISVSVAPEDTGPWGGYISNRIYIYPKTLAVPDPNAWEGIFVHEVGHSLGFANITRSECGWSKTVMWHAWDGNPSHIIRALTSADRCAVSSY
jgi:hypothetical protein